MRPHALVSVSFALALTALMARAQDPRNPSSPPVAPTTGAASVSARGAQPGPAGGLTRAGGMPATGGPAASGSSAGGGAAAGAASGSPAGGASATPAQVASAVAREEARRPPAVAAAYAAASAQAAAERWRPDAAELEAARQKPGRQPARRMPDYDGRPAAPPTVGEQLVLFPQAVFDPLYVVAENLIRRPLGWAVSTIERKQIPAAVVDFFTFGEDKNAGVVPTAFIDFGVNPSVGVYAWWDKVFADRNSLRAQFGTWGPKWLLVSVRDRVSVGGGGSYVSAYGTYTRRPDQPFFGLGPRSNHRDFSRFSSHMFEGGLDGWAALTRQSGVLGRVGVRRRIFSDGAAFSEPGIEESIAAGRFAPPPGYEDGYTAVFQRLELVLDSRPRRPARQTGGRINLEVEQGQDVANLPHGARWLRYGATGGLYYDVGRTRTIGLRGTVLMVDPLRGEVPFTEQITLGGLGPMPGYLFNRLIGRSAAVGELEYRWPVWVFFDGVLQGSVGNVFNEHLSGLSPKLLRLSGTVGLKSNNSADHQLEILTGFGTETLDDGLRVTSFRLVFGGTRGF